MANSHRLLRLRDVLSILPMSRSTWLAGVKSGRFPKGILISPRVRAWKESDILAIAEARPEQSNLLSAKPLPCGEN